jgi:hypothetical protein
MNYNKSTQGECIAAASEDDLVKQAKLPDLVCSNKKDAARWFK